MLKDSYYKIGKDLMAISKKGSEVSNAFHKYADTGDRSHIETITRDDIIATMAKFHLDRGSGWYELMRDRVAEIDAEAQYQRERKDKRKDMLKDRVLTFMLGLISGLILMWIGFKYFTHSSP